MLANSVTYLTENALGNPIRLVRLPYTVPHKAHSSNVYRDSLPVEEGSKEGRNRIRIHRMFRIRCAKPQDVSNWKSCITIRPILNRYCSTSILMFQNRLQCGIISNE
jgi:hypothetical protein